MIQAIVQNLNRGVRLLDIFDCVFNGLETTEIDLTSRNRNMLVEQEIEHGLIYFERIVNMLRLLDNTDLNKIVTVTDDLGLGKVTTTYTLGAILTQAHSHAIHHFASLGYIISQLGIKLPDADFGYNPTTPRNKMIEN